MDMLSRNNGLSRLYRLLTSTELAIVLFLAVCLLAIPGTFTESRKIYSSPPFVVLLGLVGGTTLLCTVKRLKSLPIPVLVIHGGVVLALAGAMATSFGFVATVNVYEGTTVSEAYRWDTETDTPLGMELTVKKTNAEYYPVPVQVGVLRGGEKVGLFTLKTGERFSLGDCVVQAEGFDPATRNLRLQVYGQSGLIGSADTVGERHLPPDFPYDFRLVAFKNPVPKRLWVDLRLSRDSRVLAEGSSEVNSPFHWEGLDFYHVQTRRDPAGRPYAGIQIVRDPGRPLVFSGLAVIVLGALLTFARRFYGNH